MPLLPLEPFVYPNELLFTSPSAGGDSGRWWVLHTKPRAEKSLARLCMGKQLPFYLPIYHKKWRTGGRLQSSYLPLFPGYLFLHGDDSIRQGALETNLVANAIPVLDQRQLATDLSRVHQLIVAGSAISPEERLQPGAAVVIKSGPLAGLEGKVIRKDKNCRFFVEVKMLQRGVSVEIESSLIQAL